MAVSPAEAFGPHADRFERQPDHFRVVVEPVVDASPAHQRVAAVRGLAAEDAACWSVITLVPTSALGG